MENQTLETNENLLTNIQLAVTTGKIPTPVTHTPDKDNPNGLFPPSPENFPTTTFPQGGYYTFQLSLFLQNSLKNPITNYSITGSLDVANKNLYFCYNALSAQQNLETLYSEVSVTISIPQADLIDVSSLNLFLTNQTQPKLDAQDGGGDTPAGTTSRGTKTIAVGR